MTPPQAHAAILAQDVLPIFTIYDQPDDLAQFATDPRHTVVVRVFGATAPEPTRGPAWTFASVEDARAALAPLMLFRFERDPGDPPSLVESWF